MAAKKNGKASPEVKFRIGYVTATVWVNERDGKMFRSVDLQRNFLDGDNWRSNSSFSLSDLPLAIRCMELALSHVADQEAVVSG